MYEIIKKASEYNRIEGNVYYIHSISEYYTYDKNVNTFTYYISVTFNGMHTFNFPSESALDNALTALITTGKFDLGILMTYST